MGISKIRAGHRSKSSATTCHQHHTGEPLTLHYILHHIIAPGIQKQQRQPKRYRSWTLDQLSDANFLKVPAAVWKNIQDLGRNEWMEAGEDSLTKTLAAGALLSTPNVGICKVHKWFWDKSLETTCCRKDTYRYRVIESATDTTILPKGEWYDPVDDDESKIKILLVGLPFKDHHILLLRRICPDASMEPLETVDAWRRYLAPSIRQGYGQVKKSTTYGWARPVTIKRAKKGGRRHRRTNAQLPTPPRSSTGEEAVGGCASEEEKSDN